MTVAAQLDQIFRETLSIEPPPPDTDLIATGLLDSLSVVALLVELEQHFGVTVRLEEIDLESLRTLDRLVGLIEDARMSPPTAGRRRERASAGGRTAAGLERKAAVHRPHGRRRDRDAAPAGRRA